MEIMKNELVVASELNPVDVFTGPEGIEKILTDIERQVASFTPDTSTVAGRKAIASLAYKVSQSKVVLDDLGKGLVSEWKTKSALVDASRKIARDRLDALRDKAREPLTLWEEAEEKRIAAEKLAKEIEEAHALALAENDLFNRAKELAAKEAELARIEAERLAREEAERIEREAREAAERAEAERIANEERIRVEAEEKAKREAEEVAAAQIAEAERKAAEAKAAAEKAERDRIAAEEKAKADQIAAVAAAEERARQEAARVEAERKAKEKAEREKVEAEKKEAERKAADVEHRRTVNQKIVAELMKTGITEGQAKAVVTAIAGGLVSCVSIQY